MEKDSGKQLKYRDKNIEAKITVKQTESSPPERELEYHNASGTNANDIKEGTFDPDAKKHILIIDDDEQIRRILAMVLKNAGYEITLASDGNEGLRLFHEKPVQDEQKDAEYKNE